MTSPREDPTAHALRRCRELGFALAGIADARPSDYQQELTDWLAAGKAGEMSYLTETVAERLDPQRLVPGARSIICVADRYHDGKPDRVRSDGPPIGRVARYARGRDYHGLMKRRLHVLADELREVFPEHAFRTTVDSAPVLEREHAQRAGIGRVGKHTLMIRPGIGSYLFLGEMITTLELRPSEAAIADPCGSCTRCIEACPTQAITPYSVDATKCTSYLTIEHRTLIDESLMEGMEDWIYGCDICQEVCPHNQPTRRSRAAGTHGSYRPLVDEPRKADGSGFDLLELLSWSEDERRTAFVNSTMKRVKLNLIKRNALIAAGNVMRTRPNDALLARIKAIIADDHEDAMVRETAEVVVRRLRAGA